MGTKMLHFEVRNHDHHKAGFSCVQIAHVSFLCRGVSAVFFAAFRKQRGMAQTDPQTRPTTGVSYSRPCQQDHLPPSSDYR